MLKEAPLISSMLSQQPCRPKRCQVFNDLELEDILLTAYETSNVSGNHQFCHRFVLTVGWTKRCGGRETVDVHQWALLSQKNPGNCFPTYKKQPTKEWTSAGERGCRHVGTNICWRARRWVAAALVDGNCFGEQRRVQSNKADEGAKIIWRAWVGHRIAEIWPRFFFGEGSGQF